MSEAKVCTVCRKPNPMGGQHYACATGRGRADVLATASPVTIRRIEPELSETARVHIGLHREPEGTKDAHNSPARQSEEPAFLPSRPSTRAAWETLWNLLLSDTEPNRQPAPSYA